MRSTNGQQSRVGTSKGRPLNGQRGSAPAPERCGPFHYTRERYSDVLKVQLRLLRISDSSHNQPSRQSVIAQGAHGFNVQSSASGQP